MILCKKKHLHELSNLISKFTLNLQLVALDKNIPGSWFGDEEAGIVKNLLYIREDTPLHSALHESCHFICMDNLRREKLDTNAGGGYDEENGVCFLQILLAEKLSFTSSSEQMKDMDEWGYTFRLGSAKKWFNKDADDARIWLVEQNIIDSNNNILFKLRQ